MHSLKICTGWNRSCFWSISLHLSILNENYPFKTKQFNLIPSVCCLHHARTGHPRTARFPYLMARAHDHVRHRNTSRVSRTLLVRWKLFRHHLLSNSNIFAKYKSCKILCNVRKCRAAGSNYYSYSTSLQWSHDNFYDEEWMRMTCANPGQTAERTSLRRKREVLQ